MDAGAADARLRDIFWSERASEDQYRIISRLEERSPEQAQRVYQAIQETATNLAQFPQLGKLGRVKGTREVVVPRQPYILPYRDDEANNRVIILAVMHASQQWPRSFGRAPRDRSEDS
jgi:plasmid stabilization system protein ParE